MDNSSSTSPKSPRRNSFAAFGVVRQRLHIIRESPLARAIARTAKAKARQLLLGDKDKSFHGLVASELAKPVRVKLKDKLAFTLGIFNICLSELILVRFPQFLWLWYICWLLPLMAWRIVSYTRQKWQYFLVDYCYSANLLVLCHLFIAPSSPLVFQVAFLSAVGPLGWAIVAWRNSLVFHDLEKITTLLVHLMPPLVMICRRWSYTLDVDGIAPLYLRCSGSDESYDSDGVCYISFTRSVFLPLCWYALWQAAYLLLTEVLHRHVLDSDPSLSTSLRYIIRGGRGGLHDAALAVSRRLGCLRKDERFSESSNTSKAIFVSAQLVFTIVTLLPVYMLYHSHTLCVAMSCVWIGASVWNGSEYYIEVFSKRYQASVEETALRYAAIREAAAKAELVAHAKPQGVTNAGVSTRTSSPSSPPSSVRSQPAEHATAGGHDDAQAK